MNVTLFTCIGYDVYFTCNATKAWTLLDYSISQFVLHSVWLILVQWSGTYTHLDGIIFGICFFTQQNNIDDTVYLPNDPEVCNYLK